MTDEAPTYRLEITRRCGDGLFGEATAIYPRGGTLALTVCTCSHAIDGQIHEALHRILRSRPTA